MNLLDRLVAMLGALLMVCVVVRIGAGLIRPALPGLVAVAGLLLVFRLLWRGRNPW